MSISASMLPEFDMETANTRKTLERIPESAFNYKPHEKSFSMIALATHIANMYGWGADTMKSDSFDVAPVGGEPYKEEPATSVAALLKKLDDHAAAFRAGLATVTDEQMMATWSLLSGGNTLFAMPRVACVRGMIFNHIIHHRAQLTVYLRMNDIPVPALYGPSADEQGGM